MPSLPLGQLPKFFHGIPKPIKSWFNVSLGEELGNAANTKFKVLQALRLLVDVICKEIAKQLTNLTVDSRSQLERHYCELKKEISRAMGK